MTVWGGLNVRSDRLVGQGRVMGKGKGTAVIEQQYFFNKIKSVSHIKMDLYLTNYSEFLYCKTLGKGKLCWKGTMVFIRPRENVTVYVLFVQPVVHFLITDACHRLKIMVSVGKTIGKDMRKNIATTISCLLLLSLSDTDQRGKRERKKGPCAFTKQRQHGETGIQNT